MNRFAETRVGWRGGQQHLEQASGLPAASSGAQKDKEMRTAFVITHAAAAGACASNPAAGELCKKKQNKKKTKLARSHLVAPRGDPREPGMELLRKRRRRENPARKKQTKKNVNFDFYQTQICKETDN